MIRKMRLVAFRALLVVVSMWTAYALLANGVLYSQGSCPSDWTNIGISCTTMPPAERDSIMNRLQPGGSWAASFNSGSNDCIGIVDRFLSMYSAGRVWFATDQNPDHYGRYNDPTDNMLVQRVARNGWRATPSADCYT